MAIDRPTAAASPRRGARPCRLSEDGYRRAATDRRRRSRQLLVNRTLSVSECPLEA
jgi:hypothetical protein